MEIKKGDVVTWIDVHTGIMTFGTVDTISGDRATIVTFSGDVAVVALRDLRPK